MNNYLKERADELKAFITPTYKNPGKNGLDTATCDNYNTKKYNKYK